MFTLVARGPQGYKVVRYNAFRYLDLKESRLARLRYLDLIMPDDALP